MIFRRKSAAQAPKTAVQGISGEIVAVIAAAVAAMEEEGETLRIKSIEKASVSRIRTGRLMPSPWAAAGMAQNTQPF